MYLMVYLYMHYLKEMSFKLIKIWISEHQLLMIGFDMLFASIITISFTLGMAIEYMLHYPEIQKKIQDEIDTVVGQNRLPDLNDRQRYQFHTDHF